MLDHLDELPTRCTDCNREFAENEDFIQCEFCENARHIECWNDHSSSEFVQDNSRCPGCFHIKLKLEGNEPPDDI